MANHTSQVVELCTKMCTQNVTQDVGEALMASSERAGASVC